MLKFYYKTAKDDHFHEIEAPRDGCWVHVEEATVEDLLQVSNLTHIEYSDLQDCLDKYELPRIEKIKNNTLIFVRYPAELEPSLYTSPIAIVLVSNYFITISPLPCPLIKNMLMQKSNLSTLQKPKMLIAVFLKATQEFTSQIKRARHNVIKQEKEMDSVDSDDISKLTKTEEILNQYSSSLALLREILEEIVTGRYTNFYEKEEEHIQDLLHSVKQAEDLGHIAIQTIRSLRDSYQIIFTNNLHRTIKLLTALTILFNIPTIIASIYGMNVELPLMRSIHAFLYILILILGLSLLGFYFFKRKRWL